MAKRLVAISALMLSIVLLLAGNYAYVRAGDITPTGVSQKDLVRLLSGLSSQNLNKCLGRARIAVKAASPTYLEMSGTPDYTINGVVYSKGTSLNNLTLGASTNTQAAGTYCKYLIEIDANEVLYVNKGAELTTDAAKLPKLTANRAPLGYVEIQTNSTTPFIMGTTDMDTGSVTAVTVKDLSVVNSGVSAGNLTGN